MRIKLQSIYILLVMILLMAACSTTNNPNEQKDPPLETPSTEQPDGEEKDDLIDGDVDKDQSEEEDIDLAQFFLSKGSKMHYKGEGNEFAELDVEVHKVGEQHVIIDENNGGVLMRKIYRITDKQIIILSEDAINFETSLPTEETLEGLNGGEIFLEKPLKVGKTFNGWEISEVDETVETPYQTFEGAIVLKMEAEGFTNYKYLVPEYGEVLRKSIMDTDDGTDFIVISALESIE